MLTHLSISNYAIIEQIDLEFTEGFTVITGETGAGKSILLGAIALILGNRVDTSVLNNKDKKCIVEGVFLFDEDKFQDYFKDNDLDFEKETIIRREINTNGKSRAFVNDSPVSLSLLKELTNKLIDIHSQHQTLYLQNNQFQLNLIDNYASVRDLTDNYKASYKSFIEKKRKLEDLLSNESNAKSDIDYLQFQINELEKLNLKVNEQEELEEKLELINNSEKIQTSFNEAVSILSDSENNILSLLRSINNSFNQIANIKEEYLLFSDRLSSTLIELEDLSREIENTATSLDFDTENAQYINDRLSTIFSLEQKHHLSNSNELIELLDTLKNKLSLINYSEEDLNNLKKEVKKDREELLKIAKTISEQRKKSFSGLTKIITENLKELGMPNSSFIIKHELINDFNEYGIDKIQFLFSANKGVPEKELDKIASGGELSRLMLTIKSLQAKKDSISSIIFDEIDTGVSGDIADKMAIMMKKMSKNIQVIAITHLPQVAAKGGTHIKIFKEINTKTTTTTLSILNNKERIEEIAKMLSGNKTSAAAFENAKILLES